MQKTGILKRVLSAVLSLVIVFQMLPVPLTFTAFAANSFSLSKDKLALGMNIIPSHLAEDETFLKNFVKVNGNAMNINKLFKIDQTNNASGAGANDGGVPTGTIEGSKDKFWYAEYIWNISETEKKYMQDENYRLVFEANATPHYDKHLILDNHWGDAIVRITSGDWTEGDQDRPNTGWDRMFLYVTNRENSGRKQPIKTYWDYFWPRKGFVTYSAYYRNGMDCAEPSVSGSTFYVYDKTRPSISNIYTAYDKEGENEFSRTTLANGDVKAYLIYEFNENIRFSDNFTTEDKEVWMDIDAVYSYGSGKVVDSAVKDSDQIKAKLVEIKDNKLIFEFTVKASLKDIELRGTNFSDVFCTEKKLILYDANGNEFKGPNLYSQSWITDIAGNPCIGNDDCVYTDFDGVAPYIESVTITGSHINKNSQKEPTDWTDNSAERSAIFAGVGDTITFHVEFSEYVYADELTAVLNIKDKNGNPVKVKLPPRRYSEWDYDTDRLTFTFRPLTIKDGMVKPGQMIYITAIESSETITDNAGNVLTNDMNNINVVPKQKQYLDTDKPSGSTTLTAEGGTYTAIAHEQANCFTFPLVFNENVSKTSEKYTSGINGRPFEFSFATTDGGSHAFEYYIDTKQNISDSATWKKGTTGGQKYTYQETSDGTQYYLHIKLDENANYDYKIITGDESVPNGVYFDGTITTWVSDWAGNSGKTAYKVRHQVDKTAPVVSVTDNLSMTADYQNAQATFNASFNAKDNYAVASVVYVWHTKIDGADSFTASEPVAVEGLDGGIIADYNGTAQYVHTFSQADDTGRKGEIYLELTVTDIRGLTHTVTSNTVSFNFVKATGDYDVALGSQDAPLSFPSVTIRTPKIPDDAQAENDPRTLLFIPDTRQGNEGWFWVYDLYDPLEETMATDSTDVFAKLVEYKKAFDEGYSSETGFDTFNSYAPGAFHYVYGQIDAANGTGTFTELDRHFYVAGEIVNTESIDQFDNKFSLYKFIDDTYGSFDFYLVTSTGFGKNADDYTSMFVDVENICFEQVNSKVEKFTAYVANHAEFETETTGIVLDGEDAAAKLDYDEDTGMKTVPDLDGLAVSFKITNITDRTNDIKYAFRTLDFEKSKVQLFYRGLHNFDSDEQLVREYKVANTGGAPQTIVLEEGLCDTTGWYRMVITTVERFSGEETKTVLGNFFMQTEGQTPVLDQYHKANFNEDIYSHYIEEELVVDLTPESTYLADGTTPVIGLAPLPEGWTDEKYFGVTVPEPGYTFTITPNRALRVYNVTYNAKYDLTPEDAQWIAANSWSEETMYYKPILDTAIAQGTAPYRTLEETATYQELPLYSLPMVEGTNLIVYEIENTNGTVNTMEIPVIVDAQGEKWQLDSEFVYTNDRPSSVTFRVDAADELYDPAQNIFAYLSARYDYTKTEYTFTKDVKDETFFVMDMYGNITENSITITDEDGSVMHIDGEEPFVQINNARNTFNGTSVGYDEYDNGSYVSSYSSIYHFIINAWDEESEIDPRDLSITFGPEYSARLLGLPADTWATNEQTVTVALPLAVDADGNLLKNADGTYPAWENLSTGTNGIFRTKVITTEDSSGSFPGYIEVEVWGAWKYQEELDADGNYVNYDDLPQQQTMFINCPDVYGNTAVAEREYAYNNRFVSIGTGIPSTDEWETGFLDIDTDINADGTVGIYHSQPLASLDGYGVKITNQDIYSRGQHEHLYYTYSPMITDDGYYEFTFTDLFGNEYTQEVEVTGFGDLGIDVVFSETDMTNRDVKVSVFSTGYFDDLASIVASDGTKGTINEENPLTGEITVSKNCSITIKTKAGMERIVQVANIDKTLDRTQVVYYDQAYDVYTADTKNITSITAVLSCSTEYVFAINGPSSYTFPEGSKKGDTYTFEVSDDAGNLGKLVATCPCDIPVKTQAPQDTTAPSVTVTAYAVQEETIKLINSAVDPELTTEDGKGINDAINSAPAQSVRMAFTISDASAVKVFAVPAGSKAPAYSAKQGSTVEDVAVAVNDVTAVITVTENTKFDLYFVDAAGNTTSYTTIEVNRIDYTAPVLRPRYTINYDRDGYMTVVAYFWPEDEKDFDETIIPLSAGVSREPVDTGLVDDWGDPIYKKLYFYTFSDNGSFTFTYKDGIGNIGTAVAKVSNISNAAAVVNSVEWYGTYGNIEPEYSPAVNRDVTAQLMLSKPISDVVIHRYDENAVDNLGAVITGDAPVSVSFTGTTVDVKYTENVDYRVVVLFTASASGRKGSYVLDPVQCIDKKAPAVTVAGTQLSDDKRSVTVTFTTDEETLLSTKSSAGYTTQHSVVFTDSGPAELSFSDKAGNITVYTVTENSAVDSQYLTVTFSKNADGTDPVEDALSLGLTVGETLYFKVNKTATAEYCAVSPADSAPVSLGTLQADVWTPVTLLNLSGLQMMTVVDLSTGDVVQTLISATPKDNIAPVITIDSSTVIVNESATVQEMLTALNGGVKVTDNKDTSVQFTVTGQPDSMQAGLYSLIYKATDSAGNTATEYRQLYIMAEGTPILLANGEAALPYGRVNIKDTNDITLKMQNMSDMENQPLYITYGKGMLTTGQMKYFGTVVEDMQFTAPESGYYTIYIRSQDRAEYVTYIYVEG